MNPTLHAAFRPVRLDAPTTTSVARRGALGTIGVGAQGLVRFATSFLVGRVGGPAVLGVVQSAISTALLLSLLWPTTTGSGASKFVARARGKGDPAEAEAVARHLARRTLQSALVLAAISVPVWVWVDHGSIGAGLCVAALVLGYSGWSFTRGLQFGAGQVARATAWDVGAGTIGLAVLVLLLALGQRGATLLLALAGAYGVYALASWPWRAGGRPSPALRREVDAFVALGVTGTLASTGFLQLSMIIARASDGAARAGQYAAALALATPASLLAGALSLVLFPSMAEAWGRGDRLGFRRQTDLATRMLVVVMVAVLGTLALCGRLVVHLIWGGRFTEAATLLPVLLLAVVLTTSAVASVNAMTTRSQRGVVVASGASVAGLLTGLAAWAVLAPRHGVLGVAVGYVAGAAVIAAVPFLTVWRTDGHHWSGLVLRAAAGIGAVAVGVVLLRGLAAALWVEPLVAIGFVSLWLAVSRRDVMRIVSVVRRR